ncbi:MAG: cytochrome P450, partial [Acidimicrobiales bacterium]
NLPGSEDDHPLFARIASEWVGEPYEVRRVGVALDVALIHIASMSNLFAALGWALIDLLAHPGEQSRVVAGDRARLEQCMLESIRLAQRSIMARYVLAPVRLEVGTTTHAVSPGATIATLLPLTNTSAAPGLDEWNPDRWNHRRLADVAALPTPHLVTAFGHGRHTCPAQPFSLAAMTSAVTRLLDAFELDPAWVDGPLPVPVQIGGVARAAGSCPVSYSRHREVSR